MTAWLKICAGHYQRDITDTISGDNNCVLEVFEFAPHGCATSISARIRSTKDARYNHASVVWTGRGKRPSWKAVQDHAVSWAVFNHFEAK